MFVCVYNHCGILVCILFCLYKHTHWSLEHHRDATHTTDIHITDPHCTIHTSDTHILQNTDHTHPSTHTDTPRSHLPDTTTPHKPTYTHTHLSVCLSLSLSLCLSVTHTCVSQWVSKVDPQFISSIHVRWGIITRNSISQESYTLFWPLGSCTQMAHTTIYT